MLGLAVPLEELVDAFGVAGEGDEAETVGEDLVLDDGGVVLYVDILYGDGRDLCDEDAAEGVGDGGVDTNEGEGSLMLGVVVKLDAEVGGEAVEIPRVILASVGARVIGRAYIGDGFLVDADYLGRDLVSTRDSIAFPTTAFTYPPPVELGLTGC